MADSIVKTDPKSYFGFPSCATCFSKPCERLRFGGVRPGKFSLVHRSEYSFDKCYFAADSFHEVEWMLNGLQLHDLILETGHLIPLMAPSEQLQYNLQHYVNGYSDWAGYMSYIRRLWEDRVVIFLRVPFSHPMDAKTKRWLYALEGGVELSHELKEDDLSSKAVSDGLVDAGSNATEKKDEKLTVIISLPVDQDDAEFHRDLFVLESTDNSYRQSRSVKENATEGNDTLDLEYTGVKPDLTYNLSVNHGDHGGKQVYFENIQGKDLLKNVP
jgi:hypothetical protein